MHALVCGHSGAFDLQTSGDKAALVARLKGVVTRELAADFFARGVLMALPTVKRQLSAFMCPSCRSELCAELFNQQTPVQCECGFVSLVEQPPVIELSPEPPVVRQGSDPVLSLAERMAQRFGSMSLSLFEKQPEDKLGDTLQVKPPAEGTKPPKQQRKPLKTKAAAAEDGPPVPAPLTSHNEAAHGRRTSSRISAPTGEPFVHWLTPSREVHMSGLRFKRTSDVFKQFYYKNLVLHQQNEADCVLYAAWNAIEVLSGPTHEPPPFMTISVPKDGMHMKALHDKSAFLHYLQRKNLTGDFSRHLYNQIVTPAIIRRELTSGVVVVGLKLSLLSGQKVAQIRPDLPDSVLHSICLVGYCFVRDKCYFIAKDSSGDKRTNDVLLLEYDETHDPRGIDTLEVHEMYVMKPSGSARRSVEDAENARPNQCDN